MFTRRDLIRLIIPLVIEQILAVTIGIADSAMVSSVGEAAVSGISLVDTINILLINIFSALASGGAVIAAQYLGRRDTENANIAAGQLMMITTVMSVGIMIICLIGSSGALRLIFGNIEVDVMENAKTYFWISAVSYPFLAIYNGGAALFRSMRNSKISMITSVIMNLINVAGNALLIYVFRLGVLGAGIGTLISRIAGAAAMVVMLRNEKNPIYLQSLKLLIPRSAMIRNILRIGVPNGMENGMFQIGKILVSSLIASFGTAAIAANAVANNLVCIEIIPGSAMGLAMITVIGQCIGAKEFEQAKKYTFQLMGVTYATMAVISFGIALLANPLIGIYSLSEEAKEIARELLLLHSICGVLFWPQSFTLPNALRAANDAKFTMIISIISMWTFRIGLSYLLGRYFAMGVLGVWVAMIVDWVFRGTIFIIRFLRGKWRLQKGI